MENVIEKREEVLEEERREKKKEVKKIIEEKRKIEVPLEKEKEYILIPLIKLEKVPELKIEKLELSKEIPIIEKEKVLSIPIIKLHKPSFMFKECLLDYEIPKIKKIKRIISIPIIRTKIPPQLSTLFSEFDKKVKEPALPPPLPIKVPIYRKAILIPLKFLLESFDLTINEQLMQCLEKKEKMKEELLIEKVEAETVEPIVPSTGAEEEIPELFDLIFLIKGGGKIDSPNPKIIGLEELKEDSYIGALRTICMRIYREKVGGKPEPMIISKLNEDTFRTEVERWMKAENRIFSVSLEGLEKLKEEELKKFWENVKDRVEELFSQGFGFIIFDKPVVFFPEHHMIDIINIKPKIMDVKLKKAIASMIWGFVNLNDVKSTQFDLIFEAARKKFEEKLRSIGEPYLTATSRDKDSNESDDLHYPIKLFLVKYLAKEMNLKNIDQIKEVIKTECEDFKDYRPDIYVSSGKFAYQIFEVETLFKQGNFPLKKIDETIEKYEKASNIHKVNIVIDNMAFLMHINGLRKKLKLHKELQEKGKRKFNLEFYTLDLQSGSLIPLSEIVKKLKNFK
jgi:hypothetical protein